MKEYGVHGIVTRSEKLGKAIRTVKDCGDRTPEEHFLEFAEGFKLFKGKIADVLRETRSGFNFGKVVLDGIGEDKGSSAYVEFQNENLTRHRRRRDPRHHAGSYLPGRHGDLHPRHDRRPQIRQARHGRRPASASICGARQAGLELVGPRYFGVDTDYIPLEERCKGGH